MMPNTQTSDKPNTSIEKELQRAYLDNYEEFTKFIDKLPGQGPNSYFFFTGKKEEENGKSWCIYCQLGRKCVYLLYVVSMCTMVLWSPDGLEHSKFMP